MGFNSGAFFQQYQTLQQPDVIPVLVNNKNKPIKTKEQMLAKLPDKEIYNLEKTLVKLEKDTDPIF